MRFGGAWTIQSSSENMTGCLRIIRKLNESQTTYNNYGQFLPTEYDRIIEHVDLDLEECSGKKHRANCHWPFVFKNSLCLGKLKHTSKGYNFPISFQTSCRLNDVEPVAKKTPSNSENPRRGTLGIVVSSPNISQVPTPNSRHSHATWANRRG